jgi:hypothetical protein
MNFSSHSFAFRTDCHDFVAVRGDIPVITGGGRKGPGRYHPGFSSAEPIQRSLPTSLLPGTNHPRLVWIISGSPMPKE